MNDAARDNGYKYNGKELNEDWGLGWYDYGARWYMPDLGRWGAVDPLAEKRNWLTTYNYVQNNPLTIGDPSGALDSPIFDRDGNFLGTDSEGFKGEIIIMDADKYAARLKDTKNPLDHKQVMAWANGPYADKLNDANLSPQGYSKVYTYIMKQLEGKEMEGQKISFKKLEGGIVHIIDTPVDEDGNMGFVNGASFGNPSNPPVNAEAMTVIKPDGKINITTRLLAGQGQLETVEHAQSTLGIHEYLGHGLLGIGGGSDEKRAYRLEYRHKATFDKLSPVQKQRILDAIK